MSAKPEKWGHLALLAERMSSKSTPFFKENFNSNNWQHYESFLESNRITRIGIIVCLYQL
jgi:hypothetical protein